VTTRDPGPPPGTDTTWGDPVELRGTLEVDPVAGGKRLQPTWLVVEDRRRLILSYRAEARFLPFLDKRVVVTGRPYTPGPDTQHVGADHFSAATVTLAPGETPHHPPLQEVPPPPLVRTRPEVEARDGRWARVVGTLEDLSPMPGDHPWCRASLRLGDDAVVTATYVPRSPWAPFLGQRVAVLARLSRGTDGAVGMDGGPYALGPATD
jgi:hypothetical protein